MFPHSGPATPVLEAPAGEGPNGYVAGRRRFGVDGPADLVEERPVGALALAVVVAAFGYVAATLLLFGRVNLLETAVFAVVFTVVYWSFLRYFGA